MSENREISSSFNGEEILDSLLDAYNNDPVLRALIRLIMSPIPYGIGSAIDSALTAKINRIRKRRLKTFFDELQLGKRKLDEELIQREEFLYSYFATLKASINQNREQKIRLFARLLRNAVSFDKLGTDEFDEFLSILDDLSLRELQVLFSLHEIETAHPANLINKSGIPEYENEYHRAGRYWDKFEKKIWEECSIDAQHLRSMLTRLNRTGLYESFVGGAIGYTGRQGSVTPLFHDFCDWLELKSADLQE